MISILQTDWKTHRIPLLEVRNQVFVEEQKVPAEIEEDEWDPKCIHFLGLLDDQPIATARLLPDQKTGRVAVLKKWRNYGYGKAMMNAVITAARTRGDTYNLLHAQTWTRGFYESLGYRAEGEEFDEAGIPHIQMRLRFEVN